MLKEARHDVASVFNAVSRWVPEKVSLRDTLALVLLTLIVFALATSCGPAQQATLNNAEGATMSSAGFLSYLNTNAPSAAAIDHLNSINFLTFYNTLDAKLGNDAINIDGFTFSNAKYDWENSRDAILNLQTMFSSVGDLYQRLKAAGGGAALSATGVHHALASLAGQSEPALALVWGDNSGGQTDLPDDSPVSFTGTDDCKDQRYKYSGSSDTNNMFAELIADQFAEYPVSLAKTGNSPYVNKTLFVKNNYYQAAVYALSRVGKDSEDQTQEWKLRNQMARFLIQCYKVKGLND